VRHPGIPETFCVVSDEMKLSALTGVVKPKQVMKAIASLSVCCIKNLSC